MNLSRYILKLVKLVIAVKSVDCNGAPYKK